MYNVIALRWLERGDYGEWQRVILYCTETYMQGWEFIRNIRGSGNCKLPMYVEEVKQTAKTIHDLAEYNRKAS